MNTIYVIKPLEIMAAARGKFKTYTLFYLGIPLLMISSLLMVIYGEGPFTKAIGLTGVLFFGIGGWLINRETVYKTRIWTHLVVGRHPTRCSGKARWKPLSLPFPIPAKIVS